MIITTQGGPARPARLRLAHIAIAILASISTAQASDVGLQRALLEAGCIEPKIETALKQETMVVYRANCLGSSHKIIDIVCSGDRCSVSAPPEERDRP
ncbi:hypothetical protein ACWIEX_12830 [Bosea sp. NPDC055353]